MTDNYTGWKLFDEVIIVARPRFSYNYKTMETETLEDCQGYLVDPKDKKQLARAVNWATTYDYEYEVDEKGCKRIVNKTEIPPQQFIYSNDGFGLELYKSADDSSQGGKLSFWNCWITAPDGKKFLIGIAADLLLDVLRNTTVVNGVVQDKLMFARFHGGVGMLSKSMDSYKTAIKDEEIKKRVSKGKTSKHIVGHVYETATEKNIYGGKFYRWYEPITELNWNGYEKTVGFRKMDTPVEYVFFPDYDPEKTKLSDYSTFNWYSRLKAPARVESNVTVKVDLTMDEFCKKCDKHNILDKHSKWKETNKRSSVWINNNDVGLAASNTEYTMPEDVRSALIELGYKIVD